MSISIREHAPRLARSPQHRKPVPFLENQYRVRGGFHPSSTAGYAVAGGSGPRRGRPRCLGMTRWLLCCPHSASPLSVAPSSRSCLVPVVVRVIYKIVIRFRCAVWCPSPSVVCADRRNMPGRCRGTSDGCSASNRIRPRRCRPSTSREAGPWTVEIPLISSSTTTVCSRPLPPRPQPLFIWPRYSRPQSRSHPSGYPWQCFRLYPSYVSLSRYYALSLPPSVGTLRYSSRPLFFSLLLWMFHLISVRSLLFI